MCKFCLHIICFCFFVEMSLQSKAQVFTDTVLTSQEDLLRAEPENPAIDITKFDLRKFNENQIEQYRRSRYVNNSRYPNGDDTVGAVMSYGSKSGDTSFTVPLDSILKQQEKEYKEQNRRRAERQQEQMPPRIENKNGLAVNLNWIWIVAIAVVAFLVIAYLLGLKPGGRKKHKEEQAGLDDVHITEIKFETELEKAIRLGDYKTAIRILYLECLKNLHETQQIDWQKNKTNWDYVAEIKSEELCKQFKVITLVFDYIWYGDFNVDKALFENIQGKITDFKKMI